MCVFEFLSVVAVAVLVRVSMSKLIFLLKWEVDKVAVHLSLFHFLPLLPLRYL